MKILHLNGETLKLLMPSFILPEDIAAIITSDFRHIKTYSKGERLDYFQLAILDNVAVGYSWTELNSSVSKGFLANMLVTENFRKKGIAKKLIGAAVWISKIHNKAELRTVIKGVLPEHFGVHENFISIETESVHEIKFGWIFNGSYYGSGYGK